MIFDFAVLSCLFAFFGKRKCEVETVSEGGTSAGGFVGATAPRAFPKAKSYAFRESPQVLKIYEAAQ